MLIAMALLSLSFEFGLLRSDRTELGGVVLFNGRSTAGPTPVVVDDFDPYDAL